MAEKKDQPKTKVITPKVRLSFVNVWTPRAMKAGDDPRYGVSVIIPKDDKELLAKLDAAIKAAAEAGKASKFGGKDPSTIKKFKWPLRDGDEERDQNPEYANSMFVSASSKNQPGMLDIDGTEIEDQSKIYSGVYAKVSINFYPFNFNGSMGIACGLNNIKKVEDGEALSGRASAEEDFEDDDLAS